MMQETQIVRQAETIGPAALLTSQSLAALLALAGSKKLDLGALRNGLKMTSDGFEALLSWLQKEYLVDIVSGLEGEEVSESVKLTGRGERVLLILLEQTCELPEFQQ